MELYPVRNCTQFKKNLTYVFLGGPKFPNRPTEVKTPLLRIRKRIRSDFFPNPDPELLVAYQDCAKIEKAYI